MNKFFCAIVFLALLLNVCTALSSTISGTVRDSEGAVIAKARVTIHRDYSVVPGKEDADMVTTSDSTGQFRLDVVPGFYDIFVSSPAFSPQCTKVRVLEVKPAIHNFRLRADPLVLEETGDKF